MKKTLLPVILSVFGRIIDRNENQMDNRTLTETFERLRGRLRRMASSMLGNDDDAEDALQDAFCRLFASGKLMTSDIMAEGTTVVTLRRVCLDSLKSRAARRFVSLDEAPEYPTEASAVIWEEEAVADMTRILTASLSPMQKSVFEMVGAGMDYEIVALRLGITQESARKLMSRARKILRDEYRKMNGYG